MYFRSVRSLEGGRDCNLAGETYSYKSKLNMDTNLNNQSDSLCSMEGVRERVTPDSMVKINGKSFRCHCDCNVFHRYTDSENVYICNSCDEVYKAE